MNLEVSVSKIKVGERIRQFDNSSGGLKESIAKLGLLEPIVLNQDFELLCGLRRLQAGKELGWEKINCVIIQTANELDKLDIELEENIKRRNLSDPEVSVGLSKRKKLYEEIYPQARHGGDRRSEDFKSQSLRLEIQRFTQDTAQKLHISERTVQRAVKIATAIEEYPDLAKKTKGQAILSEYDRRKRKEEFSKSSAEIRTEDCQLLEGDLAKKCQELTPESIDIIITDPPYSEKYLHLYSDLAEAASLLLKPGGSLLVMTGQSYLPDALNRLTPHLSYHWIVAYLTPGGQSPQLWQKKVNSFWKPVLWFVKGEYSGEWVGDVVRSAVNDNDKTYHQWGQSESGFTDLLKRFTREGDVILDPFMGAGTTGVVAIGLNRRFIGIDISKEQVAIARGRIESARKKTTGQAT